MVYNTEQKDVWKGTTKVASKDNGFIMVLCRRWTQPLVNTGTHVEIWKCQQFPEKLLRKLVLF